MISRAPKTASNSRNTYLAAVSVFMKGDMSVAMNATNQWKKGVLGSVEPSG
jgi:ABC-type sulfate transport system substrate-binding protein